MKVTDNQSQSDTKNSYDNNCGILCSTRITREIFILFFWKFFIYYYLVIYVSKRMTSYVENFALLSLES